MPLPWHAWWELKVRAIVSSHQITPINDHAGQTVILPSERCCKLSLNKWYTPTVLADLSSPFSPAFVIEFNPMSAVQICLGLRCTHGMNVDEGWRLFWRPPTPAAAAAGLLSAQPAPPARCRLTLRPQLFGASLNRVGFQPRGFLTSAVPSDRVQPFFRFQSARTLIDTTSHGCEME